MKEEIVCSFFHCEIINAPNWMCVFSREINPLKVI